MGKKTYAMLPNGKIMNWIDVLSKYNLYHSEGISAHVEFDDYALTKKKLQEITVVIKNDDGDFVKAVKSKNGVWVESGNEDNDEGNDEEEVEDDEEEYCEECGGLIDNCTCNEEENEKYTKGKCALAIISDLSNVNVKINDNDMGITKNKFEDSYILEIKPKLLSSILKNSSGYLIIECSKNGYNTIKKDGYITGSMYKNAKGFSFKFNFKEEVKLEQERIEKEKFEREKIAKQKTEYERVKNERLEKERIEQKTLNKTKEEKYNKSDNSQTSNENDDYITSNGKKTITRAQLPSGEIITWVELLRRCNLPHRGGSAYVNWLSYKSKDVEGRLPDVKRVDFNGNGVNDKSPRRFISKSDRNIIWVRYFGNNKNEGLCPCCKDTLNITIHKDLYIVGHNIPYSKGGTEDIGNLVPICKLCNDGMGNRYTIAEYRKRMLQPTIFDK